MAQQRRHSGRLAWTRVVDIGRLVGFALTCFAVLPALVTCSSFSSPSSSTAANSPNPYQTAAASPPPNPSSAISDQPMSIAPAAPAAAAPAAAAPAAAAPAAAAPATERGTETLGSLTNSYAEFLAMFRDPPEQDFMPATQAPPGSYDRASASTDPAPAAVPLSPAANNAATSTYPNPR